MEVGRNTHFLQKGLTFFLKVRKICYSGETGDGKIVCICVGIVEGGKV
jgi:hypothetical protein